MKHLFRALTNTSDGAFVINEQHQIIFWNQAAETILGYSHEEVNGLYCYEILGGRDEEGNVLCQRYCRLAMSARSGKALPSPDVYARTRRGEGLWINVTTLVFRSGDWDPESVIVHLFRDATDKKSNERFIERVWEASKELRASDEVSGTPRPASEPPPDSRLATLTTREREVLSLLVQGLGTEEMADTLSISEATTRNHVQNILEKLAVHSRLEAVAYVYQRGPIDGVST